MSLFSSESAWLSLAATAVLGGMLLCRSKSPGQRRSQVLCLAALWGGACLLHLSLLCSLLLLSLSCFFLRMWSSDQELLPVDQKAVLVTGALGTLQNFTVTRYRADSGQLVTSIMDWLQMENVGKRLGADSGFGHALAKHLDKLGFRVFAGVLDAKGSGAEELRKTCSEHLLVLQMDVTKLEEIKDAHSKVTEKTKDKGLWAVVNNAGIFQYPIDAELIPMAQYRKCMAVNFFGAVEVTKVFLPLLRRSKGRLVNVCSLGAEIPIKMMAAYCSTKAALTMFSSISRLELSKWGIKVAIIQPGGFQTNVAGSPDTWDKMEKEILDDISQETQDDYGQDYIHTKKSFLQIMKTRSCPDLTPVLWDIQHAISAKNPSSFYTPGKLTYQWICLSSYFPTSVLDYVVHKCFSSRYKPRALRTSS